MGRRKDIPANMDVDSSPAEPVVCEAVTAVMALNATAAGKYVLMAFAEAGEAGAFSYSWTWRFFPPDWHQQAQGGRSGG